MNETKLCPRAFRAELVKIMPGYKWTVHRPMLLNSKLTATGTKSSGMNRLSTLQVTKAENGETFVYEARSAGFGLHTPWLRSFADVTLARALRGLQNIYQDEANRFRSHAAHLESARYASDAESAQ